MKYLLAGLLALTASTADAARYIEFNFKMDGAQVDAVFDTQGDMSIDNGDWYASLDSFGFILSSFPDQEWLDFGASIDTSGLDLTTPTVHYAFARTSGWSGAFLWGGYREPDLYVDYGYLYNVSITGSDSFRAPGLTVTGRLAGPWNPVPEPATWTLMLGGFGLVGGALRSGRKLAVRFA